MKQIKNIAILIVLALALLPATSSAQTKVKFGHLNYNEVLLLMPGIDTAQANINTLKTELETEAAQMQTEMETKYEEFTRLQSTYSQTVAKLKQQELQTMYERLNSFSESAQNTLLAKQAELLAPIQKKLKDAISEVAKENHYTYIFDTSTLSFYAETEDITAKVKLKLGIQ